MSATDADVQEAVPGLEDDRADGVDRRRFLHLTAGAAATAAGVGLYGTERTQAVAPLVIAGAALGGGTAWLTHRGLDALAAEDVPDGLTPSALENRVYETTRARRSNNRSTFVDNRNLIEYGFANTLYSEGKLAAIEAINEEQTETEVLEAARAEMELHAAEIQKNLARSWNESIRELENLYSTMESHSDVTASNILSIEDSENYHGDGLAFPAAREIELANGSAFDILPFSESGTDSYDFLEKTTSSLDPWIRSTAEGETLDLMHTDVWAGLWDDIEAEITAVDNGLSDWVTNVYDDVQAAELDVEELFTNRELAELTSDDEDFPQAIADLMALHVAVDLEREAEIYFPDSGATVYGSLATTADGTIETGTVLPDSDEEMYFLTYDASQGSGSWDAYVEGIDGGELTFTDEPFAETRYQVETTAGETVTITEEDFVEQDGDWVADLTDDLEDAITEVESIDYFADVDETQYETVQLQDEFDVVTFRDSDGEEHNEASFTRTETHDDKNYITEEEWQEIYERQQELIEKYEDSQGAGLVDDLNNWLGLEVPAVAWLLALIAGIAAVLSGNN